MNGWARLATAGVLMAGMAAEAGAQRGSGVAFERAGHLRRGINLSMWFAQTGDFSPARLDTYVTAADMQGIKALGFDHVRLPIDPAWLIAEPQMGALKAEPMARLDATVKMLTDAGLNVVLDIHPEEERKTPLGNNTDAVAQFQAFWATFAQHFAVTDPTKVFFELLNEPTIDPLRWQGVQARTVARVRAVAPQHTLLVTASNYSHVDGLLGLEPVHDDNVIYTFHEYNPMWFTHQGAHWGVQGWVYLRNVPYPSTPQNVQGILGQEPDEQARWQLQQYGWDRWDASRLGAEVAAASQWAERRGVPLYCGEFGVYRAYSNPQMRATWISDVRTALESKHIGWAMWDYQADFGLVTKGANGTQVDAGVVTALGLRK